MAGYALNRIDFDADRVTPTTLIPALSIEYVTLCVDRWFGHDTSVMLRRIEHAVDRLYARMDDAERVEHMEAFTRFYDLVLGTGWVVIH